MEFIAMGGHGGYVWSAYGITLAVLAINGWAAVRRHRNALSVARRSVVETRPETREARRPKVKPL